MKRLVKNPVRNQTIIQQTSLIVKKEIGHDMVRSCETGFQCEG